MTRLQTKKSSLKELNEVFIPDEQEMVEIFKLMDRDQKGYVDKEDLLAIAKLKNKSHGLIEPEEMKVLAKARPTIMNQNQNTDIQAQEKEIIKQHGKNTSGLYGASSSGNTSNYASNNYQSGEQDVDSQGGPPKDLKGKISKGLSIIM